MLVLAFILISELPQTSPAGRAEKCQAIDQDHRRHLDKQRMELKKGAIYFDLLMWPCEDDAVFDAIRFSKTLAILDEPSFALAANAKGYIDRFRLLVFSHAGAGYIIRVDYRADGTALLTFAEAEWFARSGEDPQRPRQKRLKQKWSREIARAETASFLAQVNKADVLSSRFVSEVSQLPQVPTKGGGYPDICISFATGVLERLDRNGRHTVAQTGCGRSDAIYALVDLLHSFIGAEPLTLEPIEKPATN